MSTTISETLAPQHVPPDSPNTTDAQLVRSCLRGKQDAWSLLVLRYKCLIYSVPLKYGFDHEEAADIFQNVCIDLIAQLPHLRKTGDLQQVILAIASRTCYSRKYEDSPDADKNRDVNSWLSGDLSAEAREIWRQAQQEQVFRMAMTELTPQCRKLVHMLFFEEAPRSYGEIASELGLAKGSLGKSRQRCLEKLQRKLESNETGQKNEPASRF